MSQRLRIQIRSCHLLEVAGYIRHTAGKRRGLKPGLNSAQSESVSELECLQILGFALADWRCALTRSAEAVSL